MALTVLDDFEEGPDGVVVPGDSGGTSLMRRSGYTLGGGQVYDFAASRPGGGPGLATYSAQARSGSWGGSLFSGARALFGLEPALGVGFSFNRGDRWATPSEISGGFPADTTGFIARAAISWSHPTLPWSGGVSVDIGFGELTITESWFSDVASNSQVHVVVIDEPTPPAVTPAFAYHPDWIEMRVAIDGGWLVRIADGATLASGAFPSPSPLSSSAKGIEFNASAYSNPFTSSTDSRRNPILGIDDIYGWPGDFLTAAPFVRMFPRDDGRGMSGAPRIWPTPKSGPRVIGGMP